MTNDTMALALKARIFLDMDGTLVVYRTDAKVEDYQKDGYFLELEPNISMLEAAKQLIKSGSDVYILSAVYMDSPAMKDKTIWLQKYLPELWICYDNPEEHIIFTPVGENKLDYIKNPSKTDILLDDYTKNLVQWCKGISIKCVNGINWNHGTWHGYSVDLRSDARCIANTIRGIAFMEV